MRSSAPPLATKGPAEARDLTTPLCAAWVNARTSSGDSCLIGKEEEKSVERNARKRGLELIHNMCIFAHLTAERLSG